MAVRLERVVHANNNCTDLEASASFYETLGLRRSLRTAPERPQPGDVFGLQLAKWDAWIMGDDAGGGSLDLLQWLVPAPDPAPAAARSPSDVGLSGLVFESPDAPSRWIRDPDDTLVEVVAGPVPRIAGAAVNCSDLARSAGFYEGVLGLRRVDECSREGYTAARFCDTRGPEAFVIELRRWDGAPTGGANRSPNGIGWFRLAFLVADVEDACAALRRSGVAFLGTPGALDLGPGVPSCRAALFLDPDGTALELISVP